MRDKIHYAFVAALEKDKWTVLSDPYRLKLEKITPEIDLEAEKVIEVGKGAKRILIEIKTFSQTSLLYQAYAAFGQYMFYRDKLKQESIEYPIFLGISEEVYEEIQELSEIANWLTQHNINIIVVNLEEESITKWIEY